MHYSKSIQCCTLEPVPTYYQQLCTYSTENETLIYNSSAGGDDMKAHVLKTQTLIFFDFF